MSMQANAPKVSPIAPPRLDRWSTATVKPPMRLEYWREAVSRTVMAASVSAIERANFRGEITSRTLNGITYCYFDSDRHELVRTARDIRHEHDRRFVLSLQLSGQAQIEQGVCAVVLAPQSMSLADAGQPVTITLSGEVRRMVAVLPYSLVLRHVPSVKRLGALKVDAAHPCADIIRDYMVRLCEPHSTIDAITREVMGEQLCVLVGIATSTQLGTEFASSTSREVRKSLLLAYLKRNVLDPELTPGVTAKAVHMSVRSLHNLMQGTGQSFTEWVLDARLTHARRLLLSTGAVRRKIAEIAAECGFSDLSHFNRTFKARFGCTPSEARALTNATAPD